MHFSFSYDHFISCFFRF